MMSVMLVSFLEAYLEDGLVEIASKNPKVIKTPVIEPSRLLEIESIDEESMPDLIKDAAVDSGMLF